MRNPESSFHPQIEGLRAVAAILVAIYHIWLGRISGGVDVFFVISGFLITATLYRRLQHFKISYVLAFYSGLLVRLMPASMLVLGFVLAGSILFLSQLRWNETAIESVASIIYIENWRLALNGVDYLARENLPSPVQHYWAMSMQFQFYLAWPFVIALAAAVSRKTSDKSSGYLLVFALVFAASLSYAIYRVGTGDQAWAYFDTAARIWEFSIGGTLFVLHTKIRLGPQIRAAMGWLGVVAIMVCGVLLKPSAQFPGYAALWPTLAAVLVIVGGSKGASWGAHRVLTSAPLVSLGSVAYSIYLWHWPMLIFYRAVTHAAKPSLLHGGLIILAAIGLAYLTTVVVEKPIRRLKSDRFIKNTLVAAACAAPVLVMATCWLYYVRNSDETPFAQLDRTLYPGADLTAQREPAEALREAPFIPSLLRVREDLPRSYADGCHLDQKTATPRLCTYGEKENPARTIAVVGGSHSAQWLPTLELIAQEERYKLIYTTKSACRFTTEDDEEESCQQWKGLALTELLKAKPDAVFLTANVGNEPAPRKGYVEMWARLAEQGIPVFAVRDSPRMGFDVPECVARWRSALENCSVDRDKVLAPTFDTSGSPSNVFFADLNNSICTKASCPAILGNVLVYRDQHHLTTLYARTLAPVMREYLVRFFATLPPAGPR